MLVLVCPSDPNLVYFALHPQIFDVNVPARKGEHNEAYELVNMPLSLCQGHRHHLQTQHHFLGVGAARSLPSATG